MECSSPSAGVVFEFERSAMRGDPIPPGLSAADRTAYISLREVYAQYHRKVISRETGAADKKVIKRARDDEARLMAFGDKCRDHAVKLWSAVGGAAAEYRKNRTLENADRLLEAIYGVGIPGGEGP